jgi:ketosteroid isomerase-like protein
MPQDSTSPEVAELVKRYGDALDARDFAALESLYAPGAVASFGALGSHEGPAAIRRFFEDFTGSFADFENEFEEIRDLGGGVVFVVFAQRGRLEGAVDWVQLRSASAVALRDGRIERQANDVDLDAARAAAERLAAERR